MSSTVQESKEENVKKKIKIETVPQTVKEVVDYRQLTGKPMSNGIYTRLVFIGDYFLSRYRLAWPHMSKVKPYYLIKNKLSIDEVIPKFAHHSYLNKKEGRGGSNILVVIMFSPHLFATYEKYKSPLCPVNHEPVEFVRDVEQGKFAHKNFEKIIKGMLDVKEKLEAEGLNVLFSYLPEFNFFRRLQESFEWARESVPNCVCECYKLPKNTAKDCKVRFREGIPMINRFIYSAGLNVLKGFVFEYFPLEISFENGHFKASDRAHEGKKDVFVLDSLVAKLVYGPDVYKDLTGEPLLKIKHSTIDCMKNMRRSILGPKANRFRLLIIGDTWLKFVMSEWNVFGKTTPFFHYEKYLTFDKMLDVILTLIHENELALVVTHVPSGELFSTKSSSLCTKHTPFEYPVPQDELMNNPADFGEKLIGKLTSFYENVVGARKHCCVVFLTGYPARFSSYYDLIMQEHLKCFHLTEVKLIDQTPSYDNKVNECLKILNKNIHECNSQNGFETYDVFGVLMSNPEPLLDSEVIFPFHAFPRGRTTLCVPVRNLFLGFQRYINSLFDHCNDDSFMFIMGGKRKAANEVRSREAKRLKRIARENRKRNPLIFGSPQFPYRIVNAAEIASADGRHIRRINPAVMTNTAYNTPVIWSNKRINPQPSIIHAAMGETRDTHFVSNDQDYSFETHDVEQEQQQQPITTHYQGKRNHSSLANNSLSNTSSNARSLPVRKLVPRHTDVTEENIPHASVLERGAAKMADRYESYPGINASGYGYTVEPLYPYQAHSNSWRGKNVQKKVHAQQNDARNVYIKPIPHISTTNQPQVKFSTHESTRNPPTRFLNHPSSTRNIQADYQTEPNSSRNSQTVYLDHQGSTRSSHTTYIVEQNYIGNQATHYPVGQNYSGNAEATYITPHNYPTNHQGAYADDSSVMSTMQGNQSYGHYTIW